MDHKDEPTTEHRRPRGVDDARVEALGTLSAALVGAEDARGHLYGFHRLTGMSDLTLGDAVDLFRAAGHDDLADRLQTELVGRNVIEGRWTFQIVEEYDDDYFATFKRETPPLRGRDEGGPTHPRPGPSRSRSRRPGGRRVLPEPPDVARTQHSQVPDRFRCADTWVTSRCSTGTNEGETAFSHSQPP